MRGNAARALVPALAVLALVGVVAIAATGSTPTGSGDTRPADALLDTIFSLTLLAVVVAAAVVAYGLTQRDAIAREIASGRHRRISYVGFIVLMILLTAALYFRLRDWKSTAFGGEIGEQGFPGRDPSNPLSPQSSPETAYEPRFAWLSVLVVLALAAAGVAAAFVAARRRAGPTEENHLAEALAAVVEDTLDDLRAETDPRRAVIAAYAQLERVLAAHGKPRAAPETPAEYLARILVDLEVGERAVRRLTDLFTWAKFSQHEVDAGMKEEAIDALAHVRDELRDADARRRSEHAGVVLAAERRA